MVIIYFLFGFFIFISLCNYLCIYYTPQLTAQGQQHREEHEAVGSAEHHHAEVHSEVEHAEDLRLSETEHEDTADLSEGDA